MSNTLIEDYLPVDAIGSESSRERSLWRGHPFTLHLWWARRPLVACRAAVYGAFVAASRFVPENGPGEKRFSLGRANAAKFVDRLCRYPGDLSTLNAAEQHILEAHADRLTRELTHGKSAGRYPHWAEEFKFVADRVTVDDITAGRAPRPRVLDMFAGSGAIPLEALRLGCEAYALDLNPVAHIIELCTLVYPQQYGRPHTDFKGSANDGTWAGLAEEVRCWGIWVLKKLKAETSDLYPLIRDPETKANAPAKDLKLFPEDNENISPGYLKPVAYLWTRTVKCKNPTCGAEVPLVRQTWLSKKEKHYVALKVIALKGESRVKFKVVESNSVSDLGFDPSYGSKGGNAICFFCGTVADIDYVKEEGWAGRMLAQLMAVVCSRTGMRGKVYLSPETAAPISLDTEILQARIKSIALNAHISVPEEEIAGLADDIRENSLGITVRPYGLRRFADLFATRQLVYLLNVVAAIRDAIAEMTDKGYELNRVKAVASYLATALDRQAENSSSLCRWNPIAEKMQGTFGRQVITMVWDFCEVCPFGGSVGDWLSIIDLQTNAINGSALGNRNPANVLRGSAMQLPVSDNFFDAVITDPPYYDNVPYADISDFFYVWLKRSVGHLYPEHFAARSTPKKTEAIADAKRHGGDDNAASKAYENMMAASFKEAERVLKNNGIMVVVYAHKTTLGWSTLVDALRNSGFTVTEAWPLDTEMKSRLRGMDSAALASSIFLVARKREDQKSGNYEEQVRPELARVVHERVETLWEMRVSGADLVIACLGAGLRAFTRFARVEFANGEEVPAERFLSEVETVVLEQILQRLSKEVGNRGAYSLAGLDSPTRFYTLWRYTYKGAELDAGEAIIFANGTHVELDGPGGLSAGARALVEKKKGKYRLLDYDERGDDDKLGIPDDDGQPVPLIDVLHRTLWLMENRPAQVAQFLQEAQPNREQMRLVAQALAGPALKGGELADVSPSGEMAALAKLTANWRSVIEDQMLPLFNR